MEQNDDENLYARWLSDTLTPEEKARLEASGEAEILRAIVSHTDRYRLPGLDADTYTKIREQIERKRAKVVPFYRHPRFFAIAAGLAILLGLYWVYRANGTIVSHQPAPVMAKLEGTTGRIKNYTLSDNTGIVLYGNSQIAYDKKAYGKLRRLSLRGEAFFDVRKKGAFEVQLPNGTVNVTGTQFNVLANDTVTAVRCYEGRVEVTVGGKTTALTPGKGIRIMNRQPAVTYTFDPAGSDPASDARYVENVSLREVCASLAVQYGVSFDAGSADLDRSFTGTLRQTDLSTALKLVFDPMQITYRVQGDRIFLGNR